MNYSDVYVPWTGWQLVKLLGQGSFGRVYEIEKPSAGGKQALKAAMKVISIGADMLDDIYGSSYDDASARRLCEERVNSIRREYDIMYELRGNPNIVRCDDFKMVGHRDGIGCDLYIMMELLTPLQQMWKYRDITEDDVLRLGEDICKALVACENHKLIHRDIKPQNILVTDNGAYKLGDFGTARPFEHTVSATVAGTESYMAPEVIMRKKYGRDVDTYSLGLVMYRMLNKGKLPFLDPDRIPTASEKEASLQRRLNGEIIPAPVSGSLPLQAVVLKACSYNRKDRYRSAKDMLEDLTLAGEGTMPMFDVADDEKSTVFEQTSPGSYTGRQTAYTGSARSRNSLNNTGYAGKTGRNKKVFAGIAAALLGVIVLIGALNGFWKGDTAAPAAQSENTGMQDTGQTEESQEIDEQTVSSDTAVNTEGINTENFLTAFRNGNYDEAAEWGGKNPEYVNESVVLNMPTDIAAAYSAVAKQYATDSDGFTGMCGYTDIDIDGVPELIVYTPGPESDMKLKIFTYKSGEVTEAGELNGGHSAVYAYPGHNGMVVGWGHMGSQTYAVVSIENGGIKMEDFGSMDISEGEDYIYPGNMVWLNSCEEI